MRQEREPSDPPTKPEIISGEKEAHSTRDAHNHVSKGWLLEKLVRHEEALAAYQEASGIEPNNADILRSIGDVLTALERPQEAQQVYEKARQLDSGHP